MTNLKVRIAACQFDVAFKQAQQNIESMNRLAEAAKEQGAILAAFPECALQGYCYESREEAFGLAQTVPGPATQALAATANRLDMHLVFGLLERDGDHLYNASVLIGPDGIVGKYRKIHLPFLGVDRFVDPGQDGYRVFPVGDLKVGMIICYDGNFPESARSLMLLGADLIVLPTNWPAGAEGTASFITQARAAENHLYYLAANRVGVEQGFTFLGRSKICDPYGRVASQLGDTEVGVTVAEIDAGWARNKRIIRVPGKLEFSYLDDRRPEFYQALTAEA